MQIISQVHNMAVHIKVVIKLYQTYLLTNCYPNANRTLIPTLTTNLPWLLTSH